MSESKFDTLFSRQKLDVPVRGTSERRAVVLCTQLCQVDNSSPKYGSEIEEGNNQTPRVVGEWRCPCLQGELYFNVKPGNFLDWYQVVS